MVRLAGSVYGLACTVLVACGGHASGEIGGPVTITITRGGIPASDVRVYFQDADSSLVATASTDDNGAASATMIEGGYVTAVDPYGPPGTGAFDEVDTFAGVAPGDQLTLTGAVPDPITVQVTAPHNPNPEAIGYEFWSTCGSSLIVSVGDIQPSATISLDRCGGVADVMVTGLVFGGVDDYIYVPDLPVVDQTVIDLTTMTYVPMTSATVDLSDLPADASITDLYVSVATSRGAMFRASAAPTGAPTATAQVGIPMINGATYIVEASPSSTELAAQRLDAWTPFGTTFAMDLGAQLLTELTSNATFDPVAHALAWSEGSGGTAPDIAQGLVSVQRGERAWLWQINAPHDGESIAFPAIPKDVYDYNINAADQLSLVGVALASVPGGFDAMQVRQLAFGPTPDLDVAGAISGAMGSAAVERVEQ